MNPKQIACLVLLIFIGVIVYVSQIVHGKVRIMRDEAESAQEAARNAETERTTAEIMSTRVKVETEELRGFLKAWQPQLSKSQTQTEVDQIVDLSIRETGVLKRSGRSELRNSALPGLPKSVMHTIEVEEEYAKVWNWLGEIERRLPLTRVRVLRVSGGGNIRQLKMEVSFETPLFDLASVTKA